MIPLSRDKMRGGIPHGDVAIPGCWMNANEPCRDSRCNIMTDNRILVTVSPECLELINYYCYYNKHTIMY